MGLILFFGIAIFVSFSEFLLSYSLRSAVAGLFLGVAVIVHLGEYFYRVFLRRRAHWFRGLFSLFCFSSVRRTPCAVSVSARQLQPRPSSPPLRPRHLACIFGALVHIEDILCRNDFFLHFPSSPALFFCRANLVFLTRVEARMRSLALTVGAPAWCFLLCA